MPVKPHALPTFLMASRKKRRNLFTGFLHDIQTSGAARSGWRSWGRGDTSRTIRQLRNRSLKGPCPNAAKSPATVAPAPTAPRCSPRAPNRPPRGFSAHPSPSDEVFIPAPVHPSPYRNPFPVLAAAGAAPVRAAGLRTAADGAEGRGALLGDPGPAGVHREHRPWPHPLFPCKFSQSRGCVLR